MMIDALAGFHVMGCLTRRGRTSGLFAALLSGLVARTFQLAGVADDLTEEDVEVDSRWPAPITVDLTKAWG